MKESTTYEVIIIGGSYAGLSAAMSLGRALRHVLIIDSGKPCNASAPASHNFITHDGEKPVVIAASAKNQVLQYTTVKFLEDEVVDVTGKNNSFTVITTGGKNFSCKKLLFAAGVKDLMPAIEGFAECWGISVLHCPYCHGYEVKGEKTAVLGNGEAVFHLCMILTQWTDNITLFTNGPSTLDAGQTEKLSAHHITMIETEVQAVNHKKGYMETLTLSNGETHAFKVMYGKIPFEQHCSIPVRLGCKTTDAGLLEHDELRKTCIPGIFAAGDCTTLGRSVSIAVASGTVAGAAINGELISDNF